VAAKSHSPAFANSPEPRKLIPEKLKHRKPCELKTCLIKLRENISEKSIKESDYLYRRSITQGDDNFTRCVAFPLKKDYILVNAQK
jgi:hypothetical protein